LSDALDLLNALTLEDGRRWGDAAFDFQKVDAEAVLDQSSDTPYSFLTRGRGGAKTSDLAGIGIAAMLTQAPRGAKLYALAADRDQGRLFIDSLQGYAARTDELAAALSVDAYRVTANRRGVVLEVLAADAPSAWGLRPWFLIVDEVCQWATTPGPKALWEATSSAAAKLKDSRMVLLSSAGDPGHWSRKIIDHALTSPLWRVHEVPGPVPWLDPARLAEQKARLPESSYRRLFLNEWTASEDRLADPDDLAACVTLDGPLPPEAGRKYVVALDVGLKRDRTVALVAHADGDKRADQPELPRVIVSRLEVWQGTRENPVKLDPVEDWLDSACRSFNRASLVFDPFQAVGLAQRLEGRGHRVLEYAFSSQSVTKLTLNLLHLIRARRLALPDDPDLIDELLNVRLRETAPGVMRIDHDPDKHDDRAIALALAAYELVEGRAMGGTAQNVPYVSDYDEEPVYRSGDLVLRGDHYIDQPSPWHN
jgi:hypothetical protein